MNYAILLLSLVISAYSSAGYSSYLDSLSEDACPGIKIDNKEEIAYCKARHSKDVIKAKVGAKLTELEYKNLKFSKYTAVDLGLVPDADSDSVYYFTRWLLNSAGNKIGVVTYEGWTNAEMLDASARFDVRYNLGGQIVLVSVKQLN